MEEEIFMTKEEKLLKKAIDTKSLDDVKKILGQSTKPISKELVVPILRSLIGRSKFDFSVVELLKKRNCDLNPKLESEYRLGDYLAYFGRLSPRLISEMGKAGYSFSSKNEKGEHAGFYLIASRPLSKKVIASLKKQGVDFNDKNSEGKTAVDVMVSIIQRYATNTEEPHAKALRLNRFADLLSVPEEFEALSSNNSTRLTKVIQSAIDKIKPESYENIGIVEIYNEINENSLKAKKIKSNVPPQKTRQEYVREGA